jgi:hypothetical protein
MVPDEIHPFNPRSAKNMSLLSPCVGRAGSQNIEIQNKLSGFRGHHAPTPACTSTVKGAKIVIHIYSPPHSNPIRFYGFVMTTTSK